jgi:hypothetical protein
LILVDLDGKLNYSKIIRVVLDEKASLIFYHS